MVLRACSGCAPDVLQVCAPGHAHTMRALPTPKGIPSTRTNMPGCAQCAHFPTRPPAVTRDARTGTK
eukprot:3710464-Prymnesium_polylepis.1